MLKKMLEVLREIVKDVKAFFRSEESIEESIIASYAQTILTIKGELVQRELLDNINSLAAAAGQEYYEEFISRVLNTLERNNILEKEFRPGPECTGEYWWRLT